MEQRRRTGDLHHLRHGAERQAHVQPRALVQLQRDAFAQRGCKPFGLHRDVIGSDRQVGDVVNPGGIGLGGIRHAPVHVLGRDSRARNGCIGRIGHGSRNACGNFLRSDGLNKAQDHGSDRKRPYED